MDKAAEETQEEIQVVILAATQAVHQAIWEEVAQDLASHYQSSRHPQESPFKAKEVCPHLTESPNFSTGILLMSSEFSMAIKLMMRP